MTQRTFGGFADLRGKQLGTIRVLEIAGRNPVLWSVCCTLCASQWRERHAVLMNGGAHCRNTACFKRQEEREYQRRQNPTPQAPNYYSFDPADLSIKGRVPW
jgi:hypothetical protein